VPVVKIARLAGQFAKPRSRPAERREGIEPPAYRGDAVNGFEFTPEARTPDPGRLLRAYHCSAATLNLCRAFTAGGYADLNQAHGWNQDFVRQSPSGQHYERLADEIDHALAFMRACGANPAELRSVELYTSHEALLLDYEQALTRTDPDSGRRYDASAHFLWIGERTRAADGAHVDFGRGIRTHPGGIHIEFTGGNVTECVGGSHQIAEDDLHQWYETACDPGSTAASHYTWRSPWPRVIARPPAEAAPPARHSRNRSRGQAHGSLRPTFTGTLRRIISKRRNRKYFRLAAIRSVSLKASQDVRLKALQDASALDASRPGR
jgi:3-deoxy-D-arabino-heptulosonate 7-phosphate (DAHP) synthase class II